MTRWIYVQCEVDPTDENPPAFSHVHVKGDDDQDAYLKGARHFEKFPSRVRRESGYRFLNDYVIELT